MKRMLKKILSILIVLSLLMLSSCGKKQVVVSEINPLAEEMNFDDLVKEAIKESNGKSIKVLSSLPRIDETLDDFLEYLSKVDPEYDIDIIYEEMGDEDIVNSLNEEKKNNDSIALLIGKNANTFKELKENGRILTYVPVDFRKANGIKKEDAPNDMVIATKFSPIFTDNDEIKDIDNMWKFLLAEDNEFFVGIYKDEYDAFLDSMLTDDGVRIMKEAYNSLTDNEKEDIRAIFENDLVIKALNDKLKNSDLYKDKLDILDFMFAVDKKLLQSDDFDGTSYILGHNENYKGVAGYFNNYYIYANSYTPIPYTTLCFINFALSKFDGFKSLANEPFFYTPNNLIREEITDYYISQRRSENIEDRGYDWWKNNKQVITKDENEVKKLLDEIDKILPEGGVG